MATLTHPFDPASQYELDQDGNIRVSKDGKFGIFTTEGRYLSGDIREADPQLCVWVGNNPTEAQQKAALNVSRAARGADQNT
ncbi:MAG: hypothetical protein AAF512_17140 [Pseudomonadota bacterium]